MRIKDFSEAGLKEFTDNWTKIVAFLGKQLKHGKKFLTGDKITIADFGAATLIFSFMYNDNLPAGSTWTDAAKAIGGSDAEFAAYIETLKTELADHLATRGSYSI